MTKHEHHDDTVIELGSVTDETKGNAAFNQDVGGQPRDILPGILAD